MADQLKAIITLAVGLIFSLTGFFGLDIPVEVQTTFLAFVLAIVAWLVPNMVRTTSGRFVNAIKFTRNNS